MSIHLHTYPLSMKRVEKAYTLEELGENSNNKDYKVPTQVDNMDDLNDILKNKLLGFKNKRQLLDFTNSGSMIFFKNNNDLIEILFSGNYPKNDMITFINNLNYEFLKQKDKLNIYNEIPYDINYLDQSSVKKIKIHTMMKNKSFIESIMQESYLGYNSKNELNNFLSNGRIILDKKEDETYDIVFIGNFKQEESEKYIENLIYEYKNKVQEATYEKVLEKIAQYNYKLENEVIDNQDSIVLTLDVN